MKKNLIALAVAGALVAPVAMAEVSVSGGLQAELVSIGGDAASDDGLYAMDGMTANKQGSTFGFLKFAASEDLGGGMKALATYNMNVNVDGTTGDGNDGTGKPGAAFSDREAFVGLSGGFGTVLAGRLAAPYKSSTVGFDPFVATSFQARGNYGMTGTLNGVALHDSYYNNAIAYANGFMGGMVKVVAAVVLDESAKAPAATTDGTNGNHAKSLSVNVTPMSGLEVAIAYIDATDFGAASAPKKTATKVGAKYTMGNITVAGQYEMLDKGMTASGKDGGVAYATATYKLDDANAISVAYGETGAAVNNTATVITGKGTYTAVGFTHNFSKNTRGMVGYRQSSDDNADETAIGAGLRVSF